MNESKTHKLVLINDDYNSFLYVMACLMKFCNYEREQAEQCTVITDNVGKCEIKSGSFMEMFELQNKLSDLQLNVKLEEYAGDLH